MVIFRDLQDEMAQITAHMDTLETASKRSKSRMVYNWDRIKGLLERLQGVRGALQFLIQMLQLFEPLQITQSLGGSEHLAMLPSIPTDYADASVLEASRLLNTWSHERYAIKGSGLPRLIHTWKLEGITVGFSHSLSSLGYSITFNIKNELALRNQQPLHKIRFMAEQFIVLYDVGDRRAWLVDGATAILHLVNATLREYFHDDVIGKPLFQLKQLEAGNFAFKNRSDAVRVLTSQETRALRLFETLPGPQASYKCFGDVVDTICRTLEMVFDSPVARCSSQDSRTTLQGLDFVELATPDDPLSTRSTSLKTTGQCWLAFVRSIGAMALFGRGFSRMVQPNSTTSDCGSWTKVPKGRDYLSVRTSDLKSVMEMEELKLRLKADVKMSQPCKCADMESPNRGCSQVHYIRPLLGSKKTHKKRKDWTGVELLEDSDAVVLGIAPHNGIRRKIKRCTPTWKFGHSRE
ncbi:hypothetical protein BCR34DRAFT_191008 [Clohesyomyces aquaticus]|uniref:Uncharacterized protein n=1 Tax=Clohesyomyces aquaticus TaxID=1231657 RepID=A0A1Y1ZY98_9PLEO|nr:hypothetical protein BCR34DRAFT_191008 [Clohesyomyces aquaticus]